ncbi:alpha/beta hydrolase [Adhaeribacter arboris]|uniref:Alpha/beta hydrolase n=1 Tax=Adhaeribacter arboris TaxID=2072846 RepID=A0A2T2Y951_9BACT|nr:alpha/beta fold hydrolase [Adhaeribacter arboris]PSR51948.1 alpha/beta hydrolase [Adhaeribacter arboris]
MKVFGLFLVLVLITASSALAQHPLSVIEPCPCLMKVDSRLKTKCGYLVVPENRQKPRGNKVKIPFVFARQPQQDSTQNITLYTTGGPGYATIPVGDSLTYRSGWLDFGGILLFDQRGTKNAVPCLDCEGIDEAIKNAYLRHRSKDSLVALAVTKCRKKLIKQGIDLSAYNTVESAADIKDLKEALKIDSLTLLGISYSGGLMLTVARNHPNGIKSLLLNSPLPGYVNYEEHALFNHEEALNYLFDNLAADSVQNARFPNLKQRYREYFTQISGKKFQIVFQETANQPKHTLLYSKNELLDAIFDRLTTSEYQKVPEVIADLVSGQHEKYVQQVLRGKFSGNKSLSYGMRLSVYCSEQIAFSNPEKIKEQDKILPWLAGYPFNNVNHPICACWQVQPAPRYVKTPVYSSIPALISAGALDPWTRPFYNRLIKRTMPQAQLLLIKDKAHGAGFGNELINRFIANPHKNLISTSANVVVE